MKWFEGSINEAVATSKSRKAIFVVFVEGKDEISKKVAEVIDTAEVSSCLEREDFVAIKLESGSETYRFFVQIYQLVPVPSLFFIGENGAPIDIVAGETSALKLTNVINVLLAKTGRSVQSSSSTLIETEKNASVTTHQKNTDTSDTQKTDSTNENTISKSSEIGSSNVSDVKEDSTAVKAGSSETSGNSQQTLPTSSEKKEETELTVEEKVERARQLIELQRKQRQEEEERKEREREIERRKMGRDVQKMRQKQQELEVKQAHEDRMREKAAEAAAREKVRQQIAQDKLERKQRELALQQKSQPQSQEQSKPRVLQPTNATVTRIQFRLPTGNPHMGQFEPSSTLRSLRAYVAENIYIPYQQYTMYTSYPRTELTTDNDDKTLLELELVPTAVILILPLKSSNASKSVSSTQNVGFFSRFMWSLFAPLLGVYNFVMGYVTGGARRNPQARITPDGQLGDNGENQAAAPAGWNVPPSSGLVRRNVAGRGGTTFRAQGNIHRLHSSADDNDENNTWNGNSTQQM